MKAVTVTALVTMLNDAWISRENENRGRAARGAGVIAPPLGTAIGSLIRAPFPRLRPRAPVASAATRQVGCTSPESRPAPGGRKEANKGRLTRFTRCLTSGHALWSTATRRDENRHTCAQPTVNPSSPALAIPCGTADVRQGSRTSCAHRFDVVRFPVMHECTYVPVRRMRTTFPACRVIPRSDGPSRRRPDSRISDVRRTGRAGPGPLTRNAQP